MSVLPDAITPKDVLWRYRKNLVRLNLGVGSPKSDYRFLEDFKALRELELWAESTCPIDFTSIPLTRLWCRQSTKFLSIRESKTILKLGLEHTNFEMLPVNGQLESLKLYAGRRELDLNDLVPQQNLRTVDLAGSCTLDLSPIRELQSLTEVSLTNFATLDHLEALEELPHLSTIVVEDIKRVSDPSVLVRLHNKGVEVRAIGSAKWLRPVWEKISEAEV